MGSKVMSHTPPPLNQGDDVAGVIEKVGSSVLEFRSGDRVAAFHRMLTPGGSYAEYAIAPANTTFHVPENVTFEQAATLPLSGMTAALALYQSLGLPPPWRPVTAGERLPVLIYGGASAVGAFALQFAKLSRLNPIVTVAGNGIDFVRSLNAADVIIDYREGNVAENVKKALKGEKLRHVFDAISSGDTWKTARDILGADFTDTYLSMVDPPHPVPHWPEGLNFSRTYVSSAYGEKHSYRTQEGANGDADFAYMFYRYDRTASLSMSKI
jgi:NADPH:quinone reductase